MMIDEQQPDPGPEPVQPGTLALRQVHPTHLKSGDRISAEAFNPSRTDEGLLSTHHGRIGADESYRRWTQDLGLQSIGSFGVSVEEVDAVQVQNDDGSTSGLDAYEDGHLIGVPDHVSIDFNGLASRGKKKQAARKLLSAALERGGALNSTSPATDDGESES